MRIFLALWAFPLLFFWGWYGLSLNDINFGTAFLSRHTHDIVFALYGKILGMPAAEVPLALAKIFAFDTLIVLAIAAWRWRKSWYPQFKILVLEKYHGSERLSDNLHTNLVADFIGPVTPTGPAHPAE